MSTFGDYALQLLAGGLPAAIDYGTGVPANAQGDTGALGKFSANGGSGEKTAPRGTILDRTPGLNTAPAGLSTGAMIGIGVGIVVVLGLIIVATRR